MYIAVETTTRVVLDRSERIENAGTEFVRFVDSNTIFQDVVAEVVFTESVPDDFEPGKFILTSDLRFELNPFRVIPNEWGLSAKDMKTIKDPAIAEVQEGAKNG